MDDGERKKAKLVKSILAFGGARVKESAALAAKNVVSVQQLFFSPAFCPAFRWVSPTGLINGVVLY